jgi:hypothetical protein
MSESKGKVAGVHLRKTMGDHLHFHFHIEGAARNNSPAAQLREGTKLACLAWCLRRLGHRVRIASAPEVLHNSPRMTFFRDSGLMSDEFNNGSEPDFHIVGHATKRFPESQTIIVKTTAETRFDDSLLKRRLVVAVHHDEQFIGHERLLSVPHFVSDFVMDEFFRAGMIAAYLSDDLPAIRRVYAAPPESRRGIGFIGSDSFGRQPVAAQFAEVASALGLPHDFQFTTQDISSDGPTIAPADYLRRVGSWIAGLDLPGERPKCYRFAELVLMGTVVVRNELLPLPIVPPVNDRNAVVLDDGGDANAVRLRAGMESTAQYFLTANADVDYTAGWSPMGQAKRIVEAITS